MTFEALVLAFFGALGVRAGDPPIEPPPEPKPEVKEPEPEKTAEPEPEPEEPEEPEQNETETDALRRQVHELLEVNRYLRHQMRVMHELHDRQWSQQVQANQAQAAQLAAQARFLNAPIIRDDGHRHWGLCTCVPGRADMLRPRGGLLQPGTPD